MIFIVSTKKRSGTRNSHDDTTKTQKKQFHYKFHKADFEQVDHDTKNVFQFAFIFTDAFIHKIHQKRQPLTQHHCCKLKSAGNGEVQHLPLTTSLPKERQWRMLYSQMDFGGLTIEGLSGTPALYHNLENSLTF